MQLANRVLLSLECELFFYRFHSYQILLNAYFFSLNQDKDIATNISCHEVGHNNVYVHKIKLLKHLHQIKSTTPHHNPQNKTNMKTLDTKARVSKGEV
jgi:hypothetical protein